MAKTALGMPSAANGEVFTMWRNRYDDLWLYPMPRWFVWACNKTIGAYVLDLMLVGEVVGLLLVAVGVVASITWLRVVGYVLVAPVPLLVAMMVITAQYRQWKHSRRPPASGVSEEQV